MLLRIRTKDGTERLKLESSSATLAHLRAQISSELKVPLDEQVVHPHRPYCTRTTHQASVLQLLSRSVQAGPVPRKDAPFTREEDNSMLSSLGVVNGDLVFLDYQMQRENQAVNKAYAKDPFVSLVKVRPSTCTSLEHGSAAFPLAL